MQPLEQLLDRIRWDPGFKGAFALGYQDRIHEHLIVVPLPSIETDAENPGAFRIVDENGVPRTIPFHRVRVVYRDGREIWRRPTPGGPAEPQDGRP